jgi:FMN phosphatase YigB (HAD superfamily)
MMLVAVHPWDIDGGRAGLSTAWIDRDSVPYPSFSVAPTCTVGSLHELPAALAR